MSYDHLAGVSGEFLDELQRQFEADPMSVDPGWRRFLEGLEFGRCDATCRRDDRWEKELQVLRLIAGYRSRGHLFTRTNPVRDRREYFPTLAIKNFDLEAADLDRVFQAGHEVGLGATTLREIITLLEETYCRSIGAEYRYIRIPEHVKWLQTRMEESRNHTRFSDAHRVNIARRLMEAVDFERFIHNRFTGSKRFSLEGSETLIPAMDAILDRGARSGIVDFVIGMAHRGRLNLLANVMGKDLHDIFGEFEEFGPEDNDPTHNILGDVKYHHGHSANVKTLSGQPVHLRLAANPSHLEVVAPVALGIARGKLDTSGWSTDRICPLVIHGDAAIAGQGVVYETIQMSLLEANHCGGTIHIVINNQIGFTTNYIDGRSSTYCTDVGKVTLSPVFHVNADDVEAVVHAVEMAVDYRQKFHRDVFIDLLGYRRYGHSESDEPRYTQPVLYKAIAAHPDPATIYAGKLQEEKATDILEQANSARQDFNASLARYLEETRRDRKPEDFKPFEGFWSGVRHSASEDFLTSPDTAITAERLLQLARRLFHLPEDLPVLPKVRKLFEERQARVENDQLADWATGELLAYASLLTENVPIRISGQDCERGTFSHRHAVVKLADTEKEYTPLQHLQPDQAGFQIFNSLLAEYAALAFEYGYSLTCPQGLTIWEAQFGDFANVAQAAIDEFIVSTESKWQRFSGLTLFLPHGLEGQGPDHSSARIERWLQMCAHQNIQLVQPTTPASFFHVLRRQQARSIRKPLIVFTPKSLLRHPQCLSRIEEFTQGGFREILDDLDVNPAAVQRVLLCSGKIWYDLKLELEKRGITDTAILRLEQLYPFPDVALDSLRQKYSSAREWVYVQEEPRNQGAALFVRDRADYLSLKLITRPESDAPASGYQNRHRNEQSKLMDLIFGSN